MDQGPRNGSARIAFVVALLSIAPSACGGEIGNEMGASGASGTEGSDSGDEGGVSGDDGGTSGPGGNGGNGGNGGSGARSGQGGSSGTSGGSGGRSGQGGAGSGGSGGSAGGDPERPPAVCEPTVALHDTAAGQVVGDGTPGSCTEQAFRTLAEQGGMVRFNCGAAPVTIDITETIQLRIDMDTIIDGGGLITLDAGKLTRHFTFLGPNWMVTRTKVVLQRLTLINGKAPSSEYFPPVSGFPDCAYGYKEGGGGAVLIRDGMLEVIDCDFIDNEAALIGPDVGGGAIYVQGSAGVVISGSTFMHNTGSNGGAIGMLFANPEIYNSHFEDNTAVGIGMNRAVAEDVCPAEFAFGHPNQAGAGGLAGAVFFDGLNDESHTYVICGSTFRNNRSNELAGALFRTPNAGVRNMLIADSTFDANTAKGGGVSFIMQQELTVERSTFMNNRSGLLADGTAVGGWSNGLWVNQGNVDIVNSTFHNNDLSVEGGGGTLRNVTVSAADLPDGVTVDNSLFVDCDCGGPRGGDHNVQWPSGTACAGGTTFMDPGLQDPADNGGATPTMLPMNAAAVAGAGTSCPTEDQRGMPRTEASCAAGAVEP
jgi:hypothetical protein